MVRSKWKHNFVSNSVLKNILLKKLNIRKKEIKIYSRSSCITPALISMLCNVYNGAIYTKLVISKNQLGFKFGEFSFTRKAYFFPVKDKKKIIRR